MTARSGDALSHVNVAYDFSGPAERCCWRMSSRPNRTASVKRGDTRIRREQIGSGRICMAAMRQHRGTIRAGLLHLTITCLNLSASEENCIREQ